jgi:hypothetical protein
MKKLFLYILPILLLFGCEKTFLDPKPDDSLVVPTTLKDFQALLDNEKFMTGYSGGGPSPGLLFAGTDEYYLPDNLYNSSAQYIKNAFTWTNVNLYSGLKYFNDWASPYRTVYYANVVLDGLKKISKTTANQNDYNNVEGSALFYRAYAFYQLSQVFAQPYNKATSNTDLGIPLRLDPEVTEKSIRSSVEQTYQQIQADLSTALPLLPDKPLFNTRPSTAAVYALLARMSLGMENYDVALSSSNKCLAIHNDLIDFNTLTATATYPMPLPTANPEIIINGWMQSYDIGPLLGTTYAIIDSTLYPLYATNDLRKIVYFKAGTIINTKQFKGHYTKGSVPFSGIATDEIYLIKAECLARQGNTSDAMAALNTLLKTRWKTASFTGLSASSAGDALVQILTERRKELLMRGTRWTDLKRLNKDSRFTKTIFRNVLGKQYQLIPGDPRYTWQIPDDVINFNPGMPQNPR